MNTKEKLAIVNNGGIIDESESANSWIGVHIRKGKRKGRITQDMNGRFRALTVFFADGKEERIILNNIGQDAEYVHRYEWYSKGNKTWYRF